ncbi:Holliday junction DNA helicase subunit RuvA [Butyrivibrio sp. ob235]|uniref:Holliday junction branch migration protein RuvA n=1 Tax=Butyrivibrio sp. ob235 TaxID=1761780 RepID=UPI0008B68D7F|nr:Holliday junction branch migration protein RuvA [Butyrivibrio sp. ob235]SEK32138.1 Holliday junction DNA helicase subunit RuvA [Butyrivibrio sp. ob235]
MIAFVNGILDEKRDLQAIIDVGGIGYNVNISAYTADRLPSKGEPIKLYTYMSVREDAMNLYGFLTRDELEFFKLLISVSGIGPKGGQAILSVMTPDDLRFAIVSGDSKAISKAPGVGKKTAERLVLELKDKISDDDILSGKAGGNGENISVPGTDEPSNEAVEALVSLGYGLSEASRAVRKVIGDGGAAAEDTEGILKLALKELI